MFQATNIIKASGSNATRAGLSFGLGRSTNFYSTAAPATKPYNTSPAAPEFSTSPEVAPFKKELDTFITYLKTPKHLKVLLYRQKNKQKIVELDIKDPVTGKLYEQREPFTALSTKVLTNYLLHVQTREDVQWLMYQMKNLKPKHQMFWYNYLNGEHFAFLTYTALFKTNQHSEVSTFFNKALVDKSFKHKRFDAVYDIENYFNTVITSRILKSHLFHKNPSKFYMNYKLENSYKNVVNKEDTDKTGLARVLVSQLTEGTSPILSELKATIELPVLPTESGESVALSKYLNFVNNNQLSYISTRVLELVGNITPEVLQFNKDYKLALEKTGKADLFDAYYNDLMAHINSAKEQRQEAHLELVAARKANKAEVSA